MLETGDKAWVEYETKDLVDGDFICNAEAGEKRCLCNIDIFET